MNTQRFLAAGAAAILASTLAFIACSTDGSSSGTTASTSGTTTVTGTSTSVTADLSSSNLYEVDFGTYETVNLTVSGIKGSTVVLAKLNTGSSSVDSAETGTSMLTSSTTSRSTSTAADEEESMTAITLPNGPFRIPHPIASVDNETVYGVTATRATAAERSTTTSGASYIAYGESSDSYVAGTTTAQFWVDYYDANGNLAGFDTITATLKKVTDHAYIWVADSSTTDNKKASSDYDISGLEDAKVTLLGEAFEEAVFPGDTSLFGYEYGGGSAGTGGIDADQHISILLFDISFDENASSSGYVAGYFWSKDERTASTTNTYTTNGSYPSNGREIFYLDAKALEDSPWTIISTLAHEYQHMIHWNQVTYGSRTSVPTWQNEFQSLMAEELLAPSLAVFSTNHSTEISTSWDYFTDGPGYWAEYFNKYYYVAGLNYWNSSVYDYMYAAVFGSWLMRSYGGEAFMEDYLSYLDSGYTASKALSTAVTAASLRTTETNGTAIHPYAVTTTSTSDFFASVLPGFTKALYGLGADGTASESPFTRADARAWNSSDTGTLVLPAYTVDSSIYKYSSSNYHSSGHLLPDYISLSTTAAIPPHGFTFHSTSQGLVNATSDSVALTLTAPTSSNVQYLLIKIP